MLPKAGVAVKNELIKRLIIYKFNSS
ncbi:hypothetical protein DFAR_2480002 [Desulfarculales bacterium]